MIIKTKNASKKKPRKWVEVVCEESKKPANYWWRMKAGNGEIICHSESSSYKHRAQHTARLVYKSLDESWGYREINDQEVW